MRRQRRIRLQHPLALSLARPPVEHRGNLFGAGVGYGGEDRWSPNRRRHSFGIAASERREIGALNPLKAFVQLGDAHRAALQRSIAAAVGSTSIHSNSSSPNGAVMTGPPL